MTNQQYQESLLVARILELNDEEARILLLLDKAYTKVS